MAQNNTETSFKKTPKILKDILKSNLFVSKFQKIIFFVKIYKKKREKKI